ncbi:MAG: hypothetical protein II942_01665 [Alphaproteobacteria bacterium]|nr:hypothetical protein [Alphaproteobacteria bacterium]
MKYAEKRKHLITKVIIALIIGTALLFAVYDCAPKSQERQVTVAFERG